MITFDEVTVVGSHARILSFPAVATITSLGLTPGALHLEVDHRTPWPAVSIDGGDPVQAATLWVFLQIGGRWHATGAERLRPGQIAGDDKPEDANVNNFIGVSWLFDANRWGPMTGYVPQVGEPVGMMVVAGSTRSDDTTPVEERTKLFVFAWPGAGGASNIQPLWVEGQPPPDQKIPQIPQDPAAVGDVLSRLEALDRKLDDLMRHVDASAETIQQHISQAVKGIETRASKKKP